VEIKFRMKDLLKSMHRMDPELIKLKAEMAAVAERPDQKKLVEKKITEREQYLRPVYQQVAIQFADLHDTPERMLEKGAIQEIVPWRNSRTTLYWRLRRLLLEQTVIAQIMEVRPSLGHGPAEAMLRRWFMEDKGAMNVWEENRTVVEWLTSDSIIEDNLQSLRRDAVVTQANLWLEEYPEFATDCVLRLLQRMSAAQRNEAIRAISKIDGATGMGDGITLSDSPGGDS